MSPLLSPLFLLASAVGQVAAPAPAPAPQSQAPAEPQPPRKEEQTPVENIEGRRRPGFNHELPNQSPRTISAPSARRRPRPFRPTRSPFPIAGD